LIGGRANWPRSWFVAASLAFALALAAMSGPTGATDTAATAAEKDARFFLAVCQNALDDLAAVSRLAAEHNWKSMVDPRFPESKPEWVDGMWRGQPRRSLLYGRNGERPERHQVLQRRVRRTASQSR